MYGKCVVADYNSVHKDKCLTEFLRLKECYVVSLFFVFLFIYIDTLSAFLCFRNIGDGWLIEVVCACACW